MAFAAVWFDGVRGTAVQGRRQRLVELFLAPSTTLHLPVSSSVAQSDERGAGAGWWVWEDSPEERTAVHRLLDLAPPAAADRSEVPLIDI